MWGHFYWTFNRTSSSSLLNIHTETKMNSNAFIHMIQLNNIALLMAVFLVVTHLELVLFLWQL